MSESAEAQMQKFIKGVSARIVKAAVNANVFIATEAEIKLKQGLNKYGGKSRKSKDYEVSKQGEMPRMHTGVLRDSVGSEVKRNGLVITSKVGSGVGKDSILYAKYLEGREHDGIRPFLWNIAGYFTMSNLKKFFREFLKGG